MLLKIGHRGMKGYAKENTVEAVKYAFKHKMNGVEIDIRKTSDNRIIVYKFNRTAID